MNRKLVTPEWTTANNSTTESWILKSPLRGGVFQRSALSFGNNGGGNIFCCFFGDILKFFSPLAYIPTYYHNIGTKASDKDSH